MSDELKKVYQIIHAVIEAVLDGDLAAGANLRKLQRNIQEMIDGES